jgi:hypothetical protein
MRARLVVDVGRHPDGRRRQITRIFERKREAVAELARIRMGHSSPHAAKVYLHARDECDWQLAAALDKLARRELMRSAHTQSANRSGTQRARKRQSGVRQGAEDNGQDGT